jgi:acyl transferase domain-containing protein
MKRNVFITIVNTPTEAVIGGWPAECEQLVAELNCESMFVPWAQLLHSEVVASEQAEIARQHRFAVRTQPPIAFLSATGDSPHVLETDTLATRLAQMAREPLDFPALVERAYGAGARVFLELGGGSTTSRLIAANLKGRPNVTINIDRRGVDVQTSVTRALARLFVHRVPVDLSALGAQS